MLRRFAGRRILRPRRPCSLRSHKRCNTTFSVKYGHIEIGRTRDFMRKKHMFLTKSTKLVLGALVAIPVVNEVMLMVWAHGVGSGYELILNSVVPLVYAELPYNGTRLRAHGMVERLVEVGLQEGSNDGVVQARRLRTLISLIRDSPEAAEIFWASGGISLAMRSQCSERSELIAHTVKHLPWLAVIACTVPVMDNLRRLARTDVDEDAELLAEVLSKLCNNEATLDSFVLDGGVLGLGELISSTSERAVANSFDSLSRLSRHLLVEQHAHDEGLWHTQLNPAVSITVAWMRHLELRSGNEQALNKALNFLLATSNNRTARLRMKSVVSTVMLLLEAPDSSAGGVLTPHTKQLAVILSEQLRAQGSLLKPQQLLEITATP